MPRTRLGNRKNAQVSEGLRVKLLSLTRVQEFSARYSISPPTEATTSTVIYIPERLSSPTASKIPQRRHIASATESTNNGTKLSPVMESPKGSSTEKSTATSDAFRPMSSSHHPITHKSSSDELAAGRHNLTERVCSISRLRLIK